jgi:MFS family permease
VAGSVNRSAPAATSVRWVPILAGTALVAASALPSFLTAALAPRIARDFPFGPSALGLAIAVFYVVCTIASSLSGRWTERMGAARALRLTGAITAVCSVAIALLASSEVALLALLVVAGVGNALSGPAVSALLRDEIPAERHGVALGAQQSGAPLAALLAGAALPGVAIPFGWRWAFVLAAALAVASALVASSRSRAAGGVLAARGRTPGPRTGAPFVRLLAVAATLGSIASMSVVSFLVVYAVRSGMSERQAGLLLVAASVVAMVSRIAFGMVADRQRRDPLVIVAGMLFTSGAAALVLIAGTPLAVVVGALVALGIGWGWAGPITLAVVRRSPDSAAWAVGVLMTGLFAGVVIGPGLTGQLADRGAFTAAWIACAACALLAALTALAARRLR